MDSLLGNIGDIDVLDCGNLTKKAIEKLNGKVDEKRVCVYGGSHGGFMTGWLIGHPLFKDMWAAAALWNPVLDMTYMLQSTDIPDWIYACCYNKELSDFSCYTSQDSQQFFNRSPIS
jgi:acylaminoacyl-peptidase